MNVLSDMSHTEKNLWAELLVDLVVLVYYFPRVFGVIRIGGEILAGPAMAILVVKTIIVAIIAGVSAAVLLRVWREPHKEDERDCQFSARGTLIANRALIIFIVIVMGQLVCEGVFPGLMGRRGLNTNPLIVAHLLLLSLMFSSVVKTVAQLFHYRRGY